MSTQKSRILCALLAIMMTASIAVGCDGGDDSSKPASSGSTASGGTTSEGGSDLILENIDMDYNLDGYDFVLASHWGGMFTPERGATAEGDLILDRIEDIQTRNNCTFTVLSGTPEEYNQNMQVAASTGVKYGDIVLTNLWWYRGMQDVGYFVAWDDIQGVNLNSSKWDQGALKHTKELDGKSYGINFTSWEHMMIGADTALFFNKQLLEANNQPSPYDLIEQGKWTWDTLREMLKVLTKDVDGDGINDYWGITSCDRGLEYAVLYSNGARDIYLDEAGKYQFGFDTPAAYTAMEWLRDIENVDKTFLDIHDISTGTGDWMQANARFKEGTVGFFSYGTNAVAWDGWLKEMEDDFGLVYFPQGPNADADEYGGWQSGDYQAYCITQGSEDPEKAAYIFNRFTEPLEEGQSIDAWKDYALDAYFRGDEKAFENYQKILNGSEFNYSPMIGAGNFDAIRNGVFSVVRHNQKTPAEAMEEVAPQIEAVLDLYNNPEE